MNWNTGKVFTTIALCLSFAMLTIAQDSKKTSTVADMYVITAKAGVVNFVAGNVSIFRKNGTNGALVKGDQIEASEKVKSSANGKAEILLNPGSFVRLAENSEIEFISNSLDDLKIKVNSGSSIFEVVATKDFKVGVITPESKFEIAESGLYRVDVAANGSARLEVWKGKIKLNNLTAKQTVLKGGQSSALETAQVAVVKFDRDDKDSFELWSKLRAKELAKINDKLVAKQIDRSLSAFSYNSGFSNGFGLWVRDPLTLSYCFLPYGYGFSSPYGYGYNRNIWGYYYPSNYFRYDNYQNGVNNNGGVNNQNPNTASNGQNNGNWRNRGDWRNRENGQNRGDWRNRENGQARENWRDREGRRNQENGGGGWRNRENGQQGWGDRGNRSEGWGNRQGGMSNPSSGNNPSPAPRVESPRVESPSAPMNTAPMYRKESPRVD